MLVDGDELHMDLVVLRKVVRGIGHIKIERNRLVPIHTADVPGVGLADSDLIIWDKGVLLFQGCDLAYSSLYFDFFGAVDSDLWEETHLQLSSLFIHLKELLETLLKHWVLERVGHDVEATGLFKAWLHLEYTHLIDRGNENIYHNTLSLSPIC